MATQDHTHPEGLRTRDQESLAAHLRDQHGVQSSGNVAADQQLHEQDHRVAASRISNDYERVRLGGSLHGLSFQRCLRCRCLLEESLQEKDLHDGWHTRQLLAGPSPGDPANAQDW